jgi:hypothetical protein
MRERLQNMQRKKQVQDAATRQLEALRRHRAEREAAAKIEQGARFENLNTYFNSFSMETTSSLQNSDEEVLAEHESRWAEIEAASINTSKRSELETALLTYDTLPWPPFGEDLHRYLLAYNNIVPASTAHNGDGNMQDSTADLRRAYTRACLRWHPDKFQHRFRRLVHEEHLDHILAKVQDVARGINQAYQELRGDP